MTDPAPAPTRGRPAVGYVLVLTGAVLFILNAGVARATIRGGIGAAAGALLGGIFGGGKGAIIGVLVGGAAGVGTVFVEGNKDLILDPGTEMTIRTARSGAR